MQSWGGFCYFTFCFPDSVRKHLWDGFSKGAFITTVFRMLMNKYLKSCYRISEWPFIIISY